MSRPESRNGHNGGRAYGKGSYRAYPMNVNGTALMQSAMPPRNSTYSRFDEQVPTSDTKRMSSGLEPRQVSMDVGKAQGGGFGRVSTPAPAFPEDTEVARANGRPSMWSPAAPTSDNLQRRIDAVTRQIAEKQTEVPYNGMLGVNPFNQRRAFLGDPGYARDGLPYCRKTGTPQPDPLKYVWNSRPCNQAPAPAPANPSGSPL